MMTKNADKKREQMMMFSMDSMVPQDHMLRSVSYTHLQEKLQEYFTKEEQEELKRLLNKFCDCLDEQTEILKKERKEKSDA